MADLGRLYTNGETIIRQGEEGDAMFVIQSGKVHVIVEQDGAEMLVRSAGPGEVIGEMALVEREVRCATIRACGEVRVIRVDKQTFLRRVHEDPSLAFRVVKALSHRVRELTAEVASLMRRT